LALFTDRRQLFVSTFLLKIESLQESHLLRPMRCREGYARMQGYSLDFTVAHLTSSRSKLDSKK